MFSVRNICSLSIISDLFKSTLQSTHLVCNETFPCLLKPPVFASFPKPKFVWEFRRNAKEAFSEIGSDRGGSTRLAVSLVGNLCILGASETDKGQYRCVVTNKAGTVYGVYNLTIGEEC